MLVMAYGGPNSLEEVEPYLMDVRGFRPTAARIVDEVRERYRTIGGRSPILERTRAQAGALERALNRGGGSCGGGGGGGGGGGDDGGGGNERRGRFRTFVGMRHWHPYITAALAEMEAAGISRAVGIVMAPHYSRMSIGAYFEKVQQAGSRVSVAPIERWHLLPGYLDALEERVRSALARFTASDRDGVMVVFTAHSLPERIREWDDPYPRELSETVDALVQRLGSQPHELAYQSAAMTPEPWLGPDAGDVIARLAGQGKRDFLIAPIGFTTEHVEILYDIDHELMRRAAGLGVRLERIEMLNTSPRMIEGLAGLVGERARADGLADSR